MNICICISFPHYLNSYYRAVSGGRIVRTHVEFLISVILYLPASAPCNTNSILCTRDNELAFISATTHIHAIRTRCPIVHALIWSRLFMFTTANHMLHFTQRMSCRRIGLSCNCISINILITRPIGFTQQSRLIFSLPDRQACICSLVN